MEKHLYIFSGLGADERAFQKIDFSGFIPTFIRWEIPYKKESIENYASRHLKQIKTERPILIGLSLGGIIAVEVAKQIETAGIILIASAKTRKEIPFYYRVAGKINIHKLLPAALLKRSNFITNWFFGANSQADKLLLKNILKDTDPEFLKWGIDTVAKWGNCIKLEKLQHIHGTADHILPFRFIKCDFIISGGGHFMTLNKGEELSRTIRVAIDRF